MPFVYSPDRMPLYEHVFYDVTKQQPYRYADVPPPPMGSADKALQDGMYLEGGLYVKRKAVERLF